MFSVHTKRTRVTLSIKPNLFVVKPNDWLHGWCIFRTLSHNVIFQGICSVTLCLLRFKKQCPFDIKCLEKTFFTTGMLLRAELHWKKVCTASQNRSLCVKGNVIFPKRNIMHVSTCAVYKNNSFRLQGNKNITVSSARQNWNTDNVFILGTNLLVVRFTIYIND